MQVGLCACLWAGLPEIGSFDSCLILCFNSCLSTSLGVNPSCTCTHYAIYAKKTKNAIYVQYVPEITLVMALVMAVATVGAITFVDDDSSWVASLIDVVLLVQVANTLLGEREMLVWATQCIYKLHKKCKICKLYAICKLYIPIEP